MNNQDLELACKLDEVKNITSIAASKLLELRKVLIAKKKGPKDYVTNCDIVVESYLLEELSKLVPNSQFYSEEVGKLGDGGQYTWVIDPVDGTHNLMFGYPAVGISVCLFSGDNPLIAVIELPWLGYQLSSAKGKGSYCNGKRLHVSSRHNFSESVISFDNTFPKTDNHLKIFNELWQQCFTLRISGAASFDIAMISMGKLDARVLLSSKFVDFAPGMLLVEEAGGRCTNLQGETPNQSTTQLVVGNGMVHKRALEIIGECH